MAALLPDHPTETMIEAGARQLEDYLNFRDATARRWASAIFNAMIEAYVTEQLCAQAEVRYWWPPAFIESWITETSRTLQRMQAGVNAWPASLRAAWPPIVRNTAEAYGMAPVEVRVIAPTAEQISRAEVVCTWLLWLADDVRLIVAAHAERIPWPKIARRDGRSERTVRYRYASGIEAIAYRLSHTTPRRPPFLIDPPSHLDNGMLLDHAVPRRHPQPGIIAKVIRGVR